MPKKPKSFWNYRVMRAEDPITREFYYGVYEVHYKGGKIVAWSTNRMAPIGDTLEELKAECQHLEEAFDKPILDYATRKEIKP